MKKKLSIVYLKISTLLVGLAAIGAFTGLSYLTINTENIEYYRPVLWVICLSIIPVIFGIYYFFKLLTIIGKNNPDKKQLMQNLGQIKYSLYATSAVYFAGMPIIFYAAEKDDAPGVVLIGIVIIAVFFTVGVFISVFRNLLQETA